MGGKKDNSPKGRRTTSRYERSLQQGTGVHQTHATPHGRKGQNQVYALCPRDTSLARRGQSLDPLPYIKTSAKKIRPLSHQESSIRHILQARTSGAVEDTPGDPRQPPDAL